MNGNIVFRDRPTSSAQRLQQDVRDLVGQLNDGATAVLVVGVSLASGANSIRHNLPAAPRSVGVTPYSLVTWYMPTPPDGDFFYVTVSGAATVDLMVWI